MEVQDQKITICLSEDEWYHSKIVIYANILMQYYNVC